MLAFARLIAGVGGAVTLVRGSRLEWVWLGTVMFLLDLSGRRDPPVRDTTRGHIGGRTGRRAGRHARAGTAPAALAGDPAIRERVRERRLPRDLGDRRRRSRTRRSGVPGGRGRERDGLRRAARHALPRCRLVPGGRRRFSGAGAGPRRPGGRLGAVGRLDLRRLHRHRRDAAASKQAADQRDEPVRRVAARCLAKSSSRSRSCSL